VDTRTTAAELRIRLSAVAEALYRLESDAELSLLRDPSLLRGRSAAIASEVATRTARLWQEYPKAKDVVDALGGGGGGGDEDEVAAAIGALEADLAAVEGGARTLTEAWAALLPRLDDLVARRTALVSEAARVDATDEPEVAIAEDAVDTAAGDVTADPLDADLTSAEGAIKRAEALVATLTEQRDGLADALTRAEVQVDELARLIEQGASALERARSRVAEPEGLLEPLDPGGLDAGPQGLRPWLARIRAEADEGSWQTAAVALARWQAVADGWLANARRVLDANRAPVRRRDELRGLLDAYRAKAAKAGLSEDVELGRLHEAADDALRTAPCRLDAAEALVRSYIDAVNGAP
jgi:hypothetical protein